MTFTLITGASGGIGYEMAKVFAANGRNLLLVARREDKLLEIKREIEDSYGVTIVIMAIDLSVRDAAKKLHQKTLTENYVVDNLVNNAGFGDHEAFLGSEWERQEQMVQLNITSLMQMTYLYGNDMKKRGYGHILNLSSVAAFCAGPYMSGYYATKGYVLSFSEAVAEELKGTGVTVTALCPGPTSTGFEKAANMKGAKMFTFFHPALPADVAKYGYQVMQSGKAVAYHSFPTKIMNVGSRLLPRRAARQFARRINGVPKEREQK